MRNENAKVYALTDNDTVVGGTVFIVFALNCSPCPCPDPPAPCDQPFPSGYRGQRSDDRGLLQVDPVSSGTAQGHRAQDLQTALLIVKGDALVKPEISSVGGLRSESAAVIAGNSFCHWNQIGGGVRKAIQGRFG